MDAKRIFGAVGMCWLAAGTMAMARVIKRRSHGRKRMLMNPSITICPASVPVSVEFCPEASSASAKIILAPVTPNAPGNNL